MIRKLRHTAFTLLEVILAVAIIAMIAVTLQRFVGATLTGISVSSDHEKDSEVMSALFRYVQTELNELPSRGQALLKGDHHIYNQQIADELEWKTSAGSGLLTAAADGEWFTTLMLRARDGERNVYDLGLRRRQVVNGEKQINWVTLVPDVAMLKFEYYSQQMSAWLDKWPDLNSRPQLVRMQLWRRPDSVPELVVFTVNSSRIQ